MRHMIERERLSEKYQIQFITYVFSVHLHYAALRLILHNRTWYDIRLELDEVNLRNQFCIRSFQPKSVIRAVRIIMRNFPSICADWQIQDPVAYKNIKLVKDSNARFFPAIVFNTIQIICSFLHFWVFMCDQLNLISRNYIVEVL